MKYILIIFLSFSAHSFTYKGCESAKDRVNLLRVNWVESRTLPNLSQGYNNLCYAYTAFALSDLWRDVNKLNLTRTMASGNPLYAALLGRIVAITEKSDLEGGNVSDVLYGIRRYGMCKDSVIEKSMKRYARGVGVDPTAFYEVTRYFIEHYPKDLEEYTKGNEFWNSMDKAEKDEIKDLIARGTIESYKKNRRFTRALIEHADYAKIRKVMEPFIRNKNGPDFIGFLKKVFGPCFEKENIYLASKRIPSLNKEEHHGIRTKDRWIKKTIELLDADKSYGAVIAYCYKILKDRNTSNARHGRTRYGKCGKHAGLIIGKRVREDKVTGRPTCQLLLRNSYGHYCKRYDKSWECKVDRNKKEVGVWINANELFNNVYRLEYIKPGAKGRIR